MTSGMKWVTMETLALRGHKLRIREVDGGIFIHFNDETAWKFKSNANVKDAKTREIWFDATCILNSAFISKSLIVEEHL